MTIKLAWRNIWRNKRRSGVILTAIVVGLLGMVFMIAIMDGMSADMVEVAIENGVGHVQIHRQGFLDNMSVKLNINSPGYVIKRIENTPNLEVYAERVKVRGLISSAESSSGVLIWGVDHESEPKLNSIKKNKDEGEFLTGGKGEIYIGRSLAEKLKVGLDDKIVLRGQGLATEIVSAAFRIKGIFVSTSPEYDKYNVYINLAEAQEFFDMNDSTFTFIHKGDSIYIRTALPIQWQNVIVEDEVGRIQMYQYTGEMKKSDEKKTIDGRECTARMPTTWIPYEDIKYNEGDELSWYTDDVPFDMGLYGKVWPCLLTLRNYNQEFIEALGSGEGYPVRSEQTRYQKGIEIKTVNTVEDITEMDAPEGFWEVPEGFEKRERITIRELQGE